LRSSGELIFFAVELRLFGYNHDIKLFRYAIFSYSTDNEKILFVEFSESENTITIQAKPDRENLFVIGGVTKYGIPKQFYVMVVAEKPKLDCKEDQFTTASQGFNRVIDF
jgi:hypothetical protein